MPLAMKSVKPRKVKKVVPKFCECGSREILDQFNGKYLSSYCGDTVSILGGNWLSLERKSDVGIAVYGVPLNYCPKCGRKMKK